MHTASEVGLAHDYLLIMRGAERTFAAMAACWPGAPVYTLLFDEAELGAHFRGHPVRTSYLQRAGARQASFRRLLPLYPRAIERLPVEPHKLLVSSSSAFAHGLRPPGGTVHVCYCHTPFRYAWHERERGVAEVPRPLRPVLRRVLDRMRRWDHEAALRVDHYIANSTTTRERIARCYGREAAVVHPPVEVDRFRVGTPEDWLLVVTELVGHKRVDLALDAARLAGRHVKVVGTGPELDRLRALHPDGVEFVGRATDAELEELYRRTCALIVPNVEEFGIAAVEAQAAGRPVVALAAGGALETVVDGETGVLVADADPRAFAEAIRYTDFDRLSPERIARHAARFSTDEFRRRLVAEIERLTGAPAPAPPVATRAPGSSVRP